MGLMRKIIKETKQKTQQTRCADEWTDLLTSLMGLIIKKKKKTKIKQEMSILHDLIFLEKNKRYEQQSLIISRVVS